VLKLLFCCSSLQCTKCYGTLKFSWSWGVDLQGRRRVKTSVSLQQTSSFGAIYPNLLHKQQHVDNAVPKMQFPLFPCSVLQQGLRSLNAISLLVTGLESTRSLFPSQGVCLRKGKALTSDAIPFLHLQSHLITSPLHPIISSMCLVVRVS
jgi:hypothetical protein